MGFMNIAMVLDPFTITELGVALVGVLGALVAVLRVSACETIKCGIQGFSCKRARVLEDELKQQQVAALPEEDTGTDDFSKAAREKK